MIDLNMLQAEMEVWNNKNFGSQKSYRMLLGVMEELGELTHAHLKQEQDIRKEEDHELNKVDAIGDIVIYLMQYCNCNGYGFEDIIKKTWQEVKKRNWVND